MSGKPVTAVLFGKLPAHGDFVARGCSPQERAALDAWVTASLAAAQDRFGAAFADHFDAALPWRGRSDGGTGQGTGAVIAASQDAAGRRYPIVLFAADIGEHLLFDAIAGRWDADRLIAAAGAGPAAPIDRWCDADGHQSLEGPRPSRIVTAMLESAAV